MVNKFFTICPLCEEGTLIEQTHDSVFNDGDDVTLVKGLEGHWCPVCEDNLMDPEQTRRNEDLIDKSLSSRLIK